MPVSKRLRFVPLTIASGVLSATLLSLSLTGTLSGFAASITNSTNTAASGTLTMQETNAGATVTCTSTDGGSVSTNSATCSSINKFGGSTNFAPGSSVATTISIKNTGTVTASTFSLTPGAACTQSNNGSVNGSATDFCSKMNLTVTQGSTSVFSGTLASFAGSSPISLGSVSAGTTLPFTFTVTMASSAGNTYSGLAASVPMTWTFNS